MKPVLQYRWKLTKDEADDVLVYYGLRNYPGNLRQVIKVTPDRPSILDLLSADLKLEI
jgi:hypothetical protein